MQHEQIKKILLLKVMVLKWYHGVRHRMLELCELSYRNID